MGKKIVVLISGKLQSGKNTLASLMGEYCGEFNIPYKEDLFAKNLKDGCVEDFALLKQVVNKQVTEALKLVSEDKTELREVIGQLMFSDENYYETKTPITRSLLQIYGTEIFRNRVNDNHWVDQVVDRINTGTNQIYLITDVRFENEITRVFEKTNDDIKIVTIRVERNGLKLDLNSEHPSETGLDDWTSWNWIVENNGTLADMKFNAEMIINDMLQ